VEVVVVVVVVGVVVVVEFNIPSSRSKLFSGQRGSCAANGIGVSARCDGED